MMKAVTRKKLSRRKRIARAYRISQMGLRAPHTGSEFYDDPRNWRADGTPTGDLLLSAALNQR